MEAARFSETFLRIYERRQCHLPEHHIPKSCNYPNQQRLTVLVTMAHIWEEGAWK
jgi:hypothetical protein